MVIVAVGLFAVGESLFAASRTGIDAEDRLIPLRGSIWMTRGRLVALVAAVAARHRARLSGGRAAGRRFGDSDVPLVRARAPARARSRQRSATGAIEGVAGPEAANNAAAAGTLVPLLTLGLPTSATAAILLAAFQQYGLQPGPLLFTRDAQLVWGLIASLYIGNVMLLVLNLPLVGLWVRLLTIPRPYLHAGILVLASVGAYSVNRSIFDVGLLYAIGVAGYRDAPLGDPARAGGDRRDPRPDGRAAPAARARRGRRVVDGVRHAADLGGVLAAAVMLALLPFGVKRWRESGDDAAFRLKPEATLRVRRLHSASCGFRLQPEGCGCRPSSGLRWPRPPQAPPQPARRAPLKREAL